MAIDIKFYNTDKAELSTVDGLDLGKSRKGVPNILAFKVKNAGDVTAREVVISSDVCDATVGQTDEYAKQQLAATWRSFSLSEKGPFVNQLRVGNLKPGAWVEGIKQTKILTTNETACQLKDSWTTGYTLFKNNVLTFRKTNSSETEASGQVAKRMKVQDLNTCRDFEIEFNIDANYTTEGQGSGLGFIGFPIRQDATGTGYYLMIRFRRSDNKFQVVLYKNAKGMLSNLDRDYGTQFASTQTWTTYTKSKPFKLSCKNENDIPVFKVSYGGEDLTLVKSNSDIVATSISDTDSDKKIESGKFYVELSLDIGDISMALSNITFKTEELEQPIYMRTYLSDAAIDKTQYKSSVVVSYLDS